MNSNIQRHTFFVLFALVASVNSQQPFQYTRQFNNGYDRSGSDFITFPEDQPSPGASRFHSTAADAEYQSTRSSINTLQRSNAVSAILFIDFIRFSFSLHFYTFLSFAGFLDDSFECFVLI